MTGLFLQCTVSRGNKAALIPGIQTVHTCLPSFITLQLSWPAQRPNINAVELQSGSQRPCLLKQHKNQENNTVAILAKPVSQTWQARPLQ